MAEARGVVAGDKGEHKVRFYGISTCVWCKKTRQFLEENHVTFEFIYIDLLDGEEKEEIRAIVREWNPRESFPTVVIDDDECVVGFRPAEMKEALEL
jgi:glutaredoxin-like protein NrdH